jgi:hypothetical protein
LHSAKPVADANKIVKREHGSLLHLRTLRGCVNVSVLESRYGVPEKASLPRWIDSIISVSFATRRRRPF